MTDVAVETRRRAARLGAIAELLYVRLRHVEFGLISPSEAPPYQLHSSGEVRWDVQGSTVVYEVRQTFIGTSEASGDQVFRVACHFLLGYGFPEQFPIDPDDAAAFGEVSAVFAAHPYVREIVHSLTIRAGLPPLTLDVMRLPLEA